MTERINVTLPSELLVSLRARAKQEHRSLSNLLALMLYELMELEGKPSRPRRARGRATSD